MSLVKPVEQASKTTNEPPVALSEAREAAEKAIVAELHRIEDTASVAVQHATSQLAAARKEAEEATTRHAALQKEFEALAAKHAALEKEHADAKHKLAVLAELKQKLEGL